MEGLGWRNFNVVLLAAWVKNPVKLEYAICYFHAGVLKRCNHLCLL